MFKLDTNFVDEFKDKSPDWGFKSGPNSLGEITYFRTYSRLKPDGTNEQWYETVQRVVEGTYDIQRNWCLQNNRPWEEEKAQASAQRMYELIFEMKFLPPGRGLWAMGSDYVRERDNGSPLNNCAACDTKDIPESLAWAMDMSMLGVGVGFDTSGEGSVIYTPGPGVETYVIPDTREGWVEATKLLLKSYFEPDRPILHLDYSKIRKYGEPIKGFGGTASGPEPLMKFHSRVRGVLDGRHGDTATSRDIVDIFNMMGACVVAGNVRRTALIALGQPGDKEFANLKNYEVNPERAEWGWASNNSYIVNGKRPDYDSLANDISRNGEPGLVFLDNAKQWARTGEEKFDPATLVNPCSEQFLESYEVCCLVETFPLRSDSLEEYLEVLKYAYLYAKTVTLMGSHDPRTNAVIEKNRRIGTSVSGVVQFLEARGEGVLKKWLHDGYYYTAGLDETYSRWLGVNQSIRRTTVKPSGTTSILAGATPGVHFPVADCYIRRVRVASSHPLVAKMQEAGYHVEKDMSSDNTSVIELPIKGEGLKTESEVSIWDKYEIAKFMQKNWSDNAVSVTVTFNENEASEIPAVLRDAEKHLKTISLLPISEGSYAQMPYEEITQEEYEQKIAGVKRIDFTEFYGRDGENELFCTTDKCEIPQLVA